MILFLLEPHRAVVAQAALLPEEARIALTVGATLLLALIGAVYFMGRKMGAFGERVRSFEKTTSDAAEAGEKWNADMIAALKEVDTKATDLTSDVAEMKHSFRELRTLPGRVTELEKWQREVDARCEERRRIQCSSPNLFELPDDGGGDK
jgi:TolA-binding protein